MVKNIEELKNLIIWAKEQKLKVLKLADIHIEISDLALVESINNAVTPDVELNEKINHKEQIDSNKEDEEALFWSSR